MPYINRLNLDKMYYHDLDNYMITKGFSPNNRGKHFKEIKAILRGVGRPDINVNPAFHKKSFKVIRMASDSIYLNDEDIRKILDAKLSPDTGYLHYGLRASAIRTGINSGKKTSSGKMEKIFCE